MGIEKTCDPENTAHSLFTKLEVEPCLCHDDAMLMPLTMFML